jgi:citrate lyase synthetase
MKNKEKKFDAVKLMRELREKVNKEIANLTPEQVVEYFRKHRQQFEKEMAGR